MKLHIHLQDSQGSECKIDARNAVLRVSQGVFQIGSSSHLSFLSGKLEVFQRGDHRYFELGEAFASIGESALTLVTESYSESHFPDGISPNGSAPALLACDVCGKMMADTQHCISLNGKHINLCRPHCSETFRRAVDIIRIIYGMGQDQAPEEPSDNVP